MMKMVVLGVAIWSFAMSGSSAGQDRNAALEEAVWAKLKDEKLDKEVAEVIATTGGTVILRGKPANAFVKMKAIEAAISVEGVEAVEDELDVGGPESREQLVGDLVNKVLTYPHYTVFDDVGFQLEDEGLVVVTGYVTMPFKKDELEERIGKVTGVRELKSVIEVLPTSPSDDQLRQRLFNSIYGHDLFRHYANRTNPPIHIIVNSANVMLTGAVRNRIEKIQAESIVRSTFGVINVDNRLQISP